MLGYYPWLTGHKCNPIPADSTDFIDRIPKRIKESRLHVNDPSERYVWGIQARYDRCQKRIWAFRFLILCPTIGIFGYWLRTHKDDLQGAAVVTGIVIALIVLFDTSTTAQPTGR
jgi:hypothetical protein